MKRQLFVVLALSGAAACAWADDLDITRETLSKWVETRKLISEEKEQWELEREVLGDRIDLVRSERDTLSSKIHETQSLITDADKKREDLVKENDALKNASSTLVNRISSLERGVLNLLPTLPDPVQERIKPLSQRIPRSQETDLSLSERYQNVIGIVNELNKGANEITVVSEVRELPDGSSAEVQALYIGYARAYYCTNKGDIAGVGHPTAKGWQWEPDNAIARQVADAIAVLKNEKVAEFIPLPVSID
jgi:FtsZ-binding cell division protein ZapB